MKKGSAEASQPPTKSGQSEASGTKKNTQLRRTAMNARSRLALQQSHIFLMRDLDVNRTTDFLFAKMVLTIEDKQKIQEMPTENRKRTVLLDLLPQRGQGAFDDLRECLSSDQPWLKDTLDKNYDSITEDKNYDSITEDDLTWVEQSRDQREAESTTELVDALRENLKEKLNQWKTALEQGFSDQEGLIPYIEQPYSLELDPSQEQSDGKGGRGRARIGKPESGSSEERTDASRSTKLVENSTPGERIIIYGGAGTGKTTLLKEIARSWIDKSNPILVRKFTFMFLIPLRFVGKGSLLNTICDELKLVPAISVGELEKSCHKNERKIMFLLDSFDELRLDVIQEDISEIGDLITGRLFPRSTVVVTSRPSSELTKQGHQKIARLEEFPEEKVIEVILEHLGADQSAVDEVLRSFPAMAYLQKPINLALFLFIIKKYEHLTHSRTQADLFSLMLQYFMLACAKKKKLSEFTPQSGSFLANRNIHKDIRRLFSDLAKKCYDERKEINGVLHVEDPDNLAEYLEFGLFTKGSESDTVVLPHPLFQEFFGAAHLAENSQTWTVIFDEIREKSESRSPRPPLIDIVRPMGLENIVRFAVALSPRVCEELASLFVIERKKIEDCDNYQLVNFEYYAELLRDSSDEKRKRVLAAALLKAPVVDVANTYENTQGRASLLLSSHVIDNLDYSECVTFLKKVHNVALSETDGKLSISCTGDCKMLEICDSFPVALVRKYDCHIDTDQLIIKGDKDCGLDLPSSMFPSKVPAIRLLKLENCTLRGKMPDIDRSATSQLSSSPVTHSSLERVCLSKVKGLEHCDVITSRQCHLEMESCGNVRVGTLKTCFPALCELDMRYGTVVAETEKELMSWLATVQSVKALGLAHIRGESPSEREELEYLRLLNYEQLGDRDTSYTVKTLKEFTLSCCEGGVDLGQLFGICSQCLQLKQLLVYNSSLVIRVGDTSATVLQKNTLSELSLNACKGDVDLGALFEVCSQCQQLEKLAVWKCQLMVRVRDNSGTIEQNNTLRELELIECNGDVDLGELLEVSSQCQQLEKLTVWKCQLMVRVKDNSGTVEQHKTLSELRLIECKGDVDLDTLFEVCGRCPQLTELIVDESQVVVRVRDTRDTAKQNNTLGIGLLRLNACKGDVDLGALFEVCAQCPQLTQLSVWKSQLVVRVRDTSHTVKQNNTLSKLRLSECKGDVDLGELLEVSSQCQQLEKLTVWKCQLMVRVRDNSGTFEQNNKLSELRLSECKGNVDLGALFEVCGQCPQLTDLTVDRSQLVVRVRDTSETVKQNSTLSELLLEECIGDVDLGALFEVCVQCPQLTELSVWKSQLVVRVRDNSGTFEQNTLSTLRLGECEADVDLGRVFEVCSQCLQLTNIRVTQTHLVLDCKKVQSIKQLLGLKYFTMSESSVYTPAGRSLSTEVVKETLSRLCPSANIDIMSDSGDDRPEAEFSGRLDSEEIRPEAGVSADMASSGPNPRRRRKGPLAFLRRLFKK